MSASPNNTIVKAPGSVITDASGDIWQIIGGHVAVNGVIDPSTGGVILLAYENGKVWQENTQRLWWSKSKPSDAWGPAFGTSVSPLVGVASANNSLLVGSVTAGLTFPGITDANDDRWTITAGGQVAVNGVADASTSRVIALAYENGKVWQENASQMWWSKSSAAGAWSPPTGTAVSPVPAGSTSPTVLYLYGAVVNYTNTVSPAGYAVQAVDDGSTAVTFNYQGTNVSGGTIRNSEGQLVLNVTGTLTNAGSLMTQGGIGNAFTAINLAPGSSFRNTGTLTTLHPTPVPGPIGGALNVTGSGSFTNSGTMTLAGGSNSDFNMTGNIFNSGHLTFADNFGTSHSMITTGNIANSGVLANYNVTLIQFGYSGPPVAGAPTATLTNTGVIEDFTRGGSMTLAAGSFAHAADGYLVHDYHGTLVNDGQILANAGGAKIEIAAPLSQGGSGHVDAQYGATVQFDSTTTGGTVDITSAMIAFRGDQISFHGSAGATGFHASVVLNGASDAFDFGRSDISEMFKAATPTTGDLLVTLAGAHAPEQIADIHLVGAYHASQFQVSGNEVIFTKAG